MSRRGYHCAVFKSFRVFQANVVLTAKPRYRPFSTESIADTPISKKRPSVNPWIIYPASALLLGGASYVAYEHFQPFRHTLLAVARCSRIARTCTSCSWNAADQRHAWFMLSVWLSTLLFRCCNRWSHRLQVHVCSGLLIRRGKAACVLGVSHPQCEESFTSTPCEWRCEYFLTTETETHHNMSLGVFIKLGQHMASLYVHNHLPDWHQTTLRGLQIRPSKRMDDHDATFAG